MIVTTSNIADKVVAAGKKLAAIHPAAKPLAAARQWWRDGQDESTGERILAALQAATLRDGDDVSDRFDIGDDCPVHGTTFKKSYTFGSTMTAETEVCTFAGCRCAVAISHDPVGTYPGVAKYCESYGSAAGRGTLNAKLWAAKLRD